MKYAVIAPVAAGSTADPGWISAFARHVEACGFESLVAVEHSVVMSRYSSEYPYDSSGRMELDGAMSYPKPAQPGGVPLHIGGHSRAAARRAGRYGDGLQPLGVAGEDLAELVRTMQRGAENAGRDPAELELSLGNLVTKITPERAGKLADPASTAEQWLRSEQCGWYYADAVRPAVCGRAGSNHDRVEQLLTELIAQPPQVSQILVARYTRQFDLNGKYPSIAPFDDKIDFVIPAPGPQVANTCLGRLCVYSHVESHK